MVLLVFHFYIHVQGVIYIIHTLKCIYLKTYNIGLSVTVYKVSKDNNSFKFLLNLTVFIIETMDSVNNLY